MKTSELEQRCGELIIGGFEGLSPPREVLQRIGRRHVGGIILFKRNVHDLAQVRELCRELRAARSPSAAPLLLAIDQEGGRVQRIRAPLPAWPPMSRLGVIDDIDLTRRVGQSIGRDLRALGFDLNFAPVLDVVDNATNTVIGDRSFGDAPDLVARHGVALARGLGDVGVLACGKHFPGHGGPVADSHYRLPRDPRTLGQLQSTDLRPFAQAIAAGIPLIMAAHVSYPGVTGDVVPATLSRTVCTKLLRDVMGFRGVLCSDDLEMGAITEHGGVAAAGLGAVRAGIDVLLVCHQRDRQEAVREELVKAVRSDASARVAVEQALDRLDRLHQQRAVVDMEGPLPPLTESLSCFEEVQRRGSLTS